MKRLFNWLILFPLAIAFVVFSVSNRALVSVDLWPFPYQVTLPLYFVFLATLIVGFVVGGMVTTVAGARARARRRAQSEARTKKTEAMDKKLDMAVLSAPDGKKDQETKL